MSSPSTRNVGALSRARSANAGRLSKQLPSFRRLEDADDKLALVGNDLSAAVTDLFGTEAAADLQRAEVLREDPTEAVAVAPSVCAPSAPAVAVAPSSAARELAQPAMGTGAGTATTAAANQARQQLLSTLAARMEMESYKQMRGLLKKRGGGGRTGRTTWHWRFCILHPHAVAIHDGTDSPKGLRSAVPLKHVVHVGQATAEESGGRAFAFTLRTSIGRDWVFCCMGQTDLDAWLACIRTCLTITHGRGLTNALQEQ